MTSPAIPLETSEEVDLPQLKGPLPDDIAWLEHDLRLLVRSGAFLRSQHVPKGQTPPPAPQGSTRAWGATPDIPQDAPWAPADKLTSLRQQWAESPYDGLSFCMQLSLAEIPAHVRKKLPANLPAAGVVWVFIDLTEDWKGVAYFDPRPVADIPWHARVGAAPAIAQWTLADTLPFATEKTLPAIAANWDQLGEMYDDWMQDHYLSPSDIQIGGWTTPIQGDHDEAQTTFVCALDNQSFGDSGAVYLHYNGDSGRFFVLVETC